MSELRYPWLELSVIVPLLGVVVVAWARDLRQAWNLTVAICCLTLVCAVGEWVDFSLIGKFEAHDHWVVFRFFWHQDVFVVDELSAPLLSLVAFLYLVTVATTSQAKAARFSFGWTLFSEAVLLATLACRRPWLIILLMTVSLVPPWIEIRKRGRSTRIFLLHMGAATVFLVLGQLLVPSNASAADAPIVAGAL